MKLFQMSICQEKMGFGLPKETQDFHLTHRELSIGIMTPSAMSTTTSGRRFFRFFVAPKFLNFSFFTALKDFRILFMFMVFVFILCDLFHSETLYKSKLLLMSATNGHFLTCIPSLTPDDPLFHLDGQTEPLEFLGITSSIFNEEKFTYVRHALGYHWTADLV